MNMGNHVYVESIMEQILRVPKIVYNPNEQKLSSLIPKKNFNSFKKTTLDRI